MFSNILDYKYDEIRSDLIDRLNKIADDIEKISTNYDDDSFEFCSTSLKIYDKENMDDQKLLQTLKELKESENDVIIIS